METAAHDQGDAFGNSHAGDLRGAAAGVEQREAHPQRGRALESDDPVAKRAFARTVRAREHRAVGDEGRQAALTELGAEVFLVFDYVHEGRRASVGQVPEDERLAGDPGELTGQQVGGPLSQDAAAGRRQTNFETGLYGSRFGSVAEDVDRGALQHLLSARIDPDYSAVPRPGAIPGARNRLVHAARQVVGEPDPPDPIPEELRRKPRHPSVHPEPDARRGSEGGRGPPGPRKR